MPPPNLVRKCQEGLWQAVHPNETHASPPEKGEAHTDRAGENLFFLLFSSAEVIITTAGEFVRLGDKDLNGSLETPQSPQTATRIEMTSAFELAT